MDFSSSSVQDVAEEIGRRIKALRLRRNITQKCLADATLLSLNTIKALESGNAKLSTVVAVLRHLGALDAIVSSVPELSVDASPRPGARGRPRQRASGERRERSQKGLPAD